MICRIFEGRFASYTLIGAGAETFGEAAAKLNLDRRVRTFERLQISIGDKNSFLQYRLRSCIDRITARRQFQSLMRAPVRGIII